MLNVISPTVLLSTSVAVSVVVIVPPSLPLPFTAAAIDASVVITDTSAGVSSYVVKEAPIPAGGALKVISGQKIVLEATDIIKAAASAGSSADCIVSILEDVG